MATPHVTGAAALIASEFPGLHPADLRPAILMAAPAYRVADRPGCHGRTPEHSGQHRAGRPCSCHHDQRYLLSLADAGATVTFTFPKRLRVFPASDISVSPGHGAISGLTTANNIVWTATFTPANVETGARGFLSATVLLDDRHFGREGESAPFAIDRIAPGITVNSIAATKDGTGANVDGTLSAALAW